MDVPGSQFQKKGVSEWLSQTSLGLVCPLTRQAPTCFVFSFAMLSVFKRSLPRESRQVVARPGGPGGPEVYRMPKEQVGATATAPCCHAGQFIFGQANKLGLTVPLKLVASCTQHPQLTTNLSAGKGVSAIMSR